MTDLLKKLTEPFAPKFMTWKPGATKESKCLALAYADLRAYQDRLDDVCGLDWSCKYVPWGDGRIICELTIGGVTRSSTGEMDSQDEKNGMGGTVAEAQALKRAAAQFGLGRYLYDLPSVWIEFDPQRKRITEGGMKELETRYATWYAKNMAAQKPAPAVDESLWDTPAAHSKQPDALSPAQLTRIHILGKQVYGDAWKVEGPKMVHDVSNGAVTSSKELSREEASRLITDLDHQLKEKQPHANGIAA